MNDKYISVDNASELLGVSHVYLWELMDKGELQFIEDQYGIFFKESDIEKLRSQDA